MKKTKAQIASNARKDVQRGKFRNQYLIYCRKSTDEAESQKNSIAYQTHEITRFAKREMFAVAPVTLPEFCTDGVISEKHSGFKESDQLVLKKDGTVQYKIDRPKFQRLLRFLSEGQFRGVICLCWDRISRNQGDDTIIRKLMRRGIEVHFVYASYDQSSAGELHMDIDGMFSQHHSRVTSEKVKLATRTKRAEGKCTYRAPIGYLNVGSVDNKPLDKARAPIIRELFELYATGDWSLADLAQHAEKQGLTSVPSRKRRTQQEILSDDTEDINDRPKIARPLGKNRITKILRNRFYVGQIIGPDGAYIASTSHETLIDLETFQRVQQLLAAKRISQHHPEKIDYPFRGFARCGKCHRVYTPYEKKGILYLAVNCVKGCTNTRKNINAAFIDGALFRALDQITLSDEDLERINAQADTQIALLAEKQQKQAASRERERTRVHDDLDYLRSHQLTLLRAGTYTPESLREEQEKLENQLDDLQAEEQVSEEAMRALTKDVLKISELLKSLTELYRMATAHEKHQIAKILCSELSVDQNTANIKPQIGMELIFEAKVLICAQRDWFSELVLSHKQINFGARRLLQTVRHISVSCI